MGINVGIDGNGHFIGGGEIVQNDNLKLYLDPYDYGSMGANGGSHIRDLSAYENDMVLIGTAANKNNGHWHFDGSDDFAYRTDDSDGRFDFATKNSDDEFIDDFTIQLWVYLDTDSDMGIIQKGKFNNPPNTGWYIYYNSTSNAIVFGGHTTSSVVSTTSDVSITQWFNIALVVDRDANVKLYINGDLKTTYGYATKTIDVSTDSHLIIGGKQTSGDTETHSTDTITDDFDGHIGPVLIYKQALTGNEINQNFDVYRGIYGI